MQARASAGDHREAPRHFLRPFLQVWMPQSLGMQPHLCLLHLLGGPTRSKDAALETDTVFCILSCWDICPLSWAGPLPFPVPLGTLSFVDNIALRCYLLPWPISQKCQRCGRENLLLLLLSSSKSWYSRQCLLALLWVRAVCFSS